MKYISLLVLAIALLGCSSTKLYRPVTVPHVHDKTEEYIYCSNLDESKYKKYKLYDDKSYIIVKLGCWIVWLDRYYKTGSGARKDIARESIERLMKELEEML